MDSTTLKKKRGRKPKVQSDASVLAAAVLDIAEGASGIVAPKSKRGRKPKYVYNNYEQPTDAINNSTSDDENIIMQLKVGHTFENVDNMDSHHNQEQVHNMNHDDMLLMRSDMNTPDAYNEDFSNSFFSQPLEVEYKHTDRRHLFDHAWNDTSSLKIIDLLKDFEEKNKNNEWPATTSIHCYWCCHKFESSPFGIPVKYVESKFHVFGCFCSLECAAAYNFSSNDSMDEVWERYSLINMLAKKVEYKTFVKAAPNRLSLKMFGGYLDIDEFRTFCLTSKIVNINFPPMMTITLQVEEINECDINSDYKYIPLDSERINKYKERITLRRNKPVTNYKNTLDHTMNIKISSEIGLMDPS